MALYILNSLITPFRDAEAVFKIRRIDVKEARELVKDKKIVSAIGHEATAQILTMLLGAAVLVNRIQVFFAPGDEAIVFTLKQRLPEGVIIRSVEELEKIGYELYHVARIK